MVNACLHMICGNCGSNNRWTYEITQDGKDIDDILYPDVYISCENCGTVHTFDEVDAEDKTTDYKALDDVIRGGVDTMLYCAIQDLEEYIMHNGDDKELNNILSQLIECKEFINKGVCHEG